MKGVLAVLALCIVACMATAPLLNMNAPQRVPDQYLVVLNKDTTPEMHEQHVANLKTRLAPHENVRHTFRIGDLVGYSAVLSKDNLEAELANEKVQYIEADQIVTAVAITQTGATWGIDRIDQQKLPLDELYHYYESSGEGVECYIIDTGIYTQHTDFGTRASFGFDATGEGNTDGNGHGTHVASTTAGNVYGVAKKCTLIAVKVLGANGSGTWDGVVKGIEWVTNNHGNRGPNAKSVANMSLGGGISAVVDTAVANSVVEGVHYAIAAGNSNANACNYSPARVPTAVTVGATTNTDARASFSNIGTCVDVFAPGNGITAAWIGNPTALNTISGTSMASPHVCGAIAVHLGHSKDPLTPAAVHDWVIRTATQGVVSNPGTGSPNAFLYSAFE